MRKIVKVSVFLILTLFGEVLCAQEEVGWEIKFSGYTQERYDWGSGEVNNDRTRIRFNLVNQNRSCGVYSEFDVSAAEDSHGDLKRSNWLQVFYGLCEVGEKTKVGFGRLFVRGGFATYFPGGIVTARYPKAYPFNGFYVYGMDIRHSSDRWELAGTVSGASGLNFNEPGQFDRIEFAGRAKRSLGDNTGHFSFAIQVADTFLVSGVEFRYKVRDLNFSGGIFYTTQDDDSPFSGIGQVDWSLDDKDKFSFHQQLEWRKSGEFVSTTGIGFRWKGLYFVGDYEYDFDNGGSILGAVRYSW